MKIIAVIPARAGSKGIPNKNIRLINGKPLIWYTINNAKKSRIISDIIVTTDSKEIEIIAKQMKVSCKKRNENLAGDDITLDSVVYDACNNISCDYVVTLQPTSPTLQVQTLDNALQYTIDNNLDTVISVINKPHLSWREEDGKKVPNYTLRLNRQYLPANYLETGAFLISKKNVITKDTRIGHKLDVFEVSEDESIDVDSFFDLQIVKNIINKEKVAIYVNGNNKRGIGHIYRALELADEFYSKPDIYYDINQTKKEVFGYTTHNIIGVNGIGELLEILKKEQYTIFINDVLTTSIDYMIAIRQAIPLAKIINFEDDGEGIYKADLVINALYNNINLNHVKCGEKYYIASKLFMFYEPITINKKVKKVFISFGGADPQNYSDRLLKIVSNDKYKEINFIVVLGRAKLNVDKLLEYNKYSNIEVYFDVKNIAELMSECDIGITSRGRTGYELAILGIPTIAMAQNNREEKHGFVCNENGFTYIGLNPSDYIIETNLNMYINMSQNERLIYHNKLLSHDLKLGRDRVMKLIRNI
ncbi:cytidyltransferase [uncultured Thomasclavelia sp.]|uniref:cytidylyltransferase domain-containing protein n=1 Tax=uncultured Thomasclavelia sp. TaxID=3025759 RepID=UPI00262A488B|nr:cytidyltransferase [uncultured Thomasclavelia sp.]